MNAKTTKFLAVLAVLAMAFALFAVIAPAQDSDAADAKELDATEWDKPTLDNEGGYKLTKTLKPTSGAPNLIVSLTIQNGGVLDLSECGLLTVSGEGSITVENGGKIIGANSSTKGIILKATSGTPIVFKEGAIIGYAEYDSVILGNSSDAGDLNIFAASNTAANCYGLIQLQDIKAGYGGLSISVGTNSVITISGAANKADSETTGKVTIPRFETWGKLNNANYQGDVTIGDLIVGTGVFCFTFGYIEGDVEMGGVLFNEEGGNVTAMNILKPGASIKVTTTGALRGQINYSDGNAVKAVVEATKLGPGAEGGSASSVAFDMNKCGASGFTVEYVDATTDYVAIQGTPAFGSGIIEANAVIYIMDEVTVPEGANFSFPDGSTLNATAKITNKGVMVLRGTASAIDNEKNIRLYGSITTLDNDGTVTILDPAASITNRTGTGTIDITGVSEDVTLSGNVITKGTIFNKLQNVTLIGDTVIKKDASITFAGNLIIPAGITLTIEEGGLMIMDGVFSKITNDGEIIIEGTKATDGALKLNGGEVINNNTIMAAFESSTKATNPTVVIGMNTIFKNNDYFLVGENNIVTNNTNTIVNSAGATLEIVGDMGGTIINSGTVAVNSENNVTATTVIKNAANGATVTVMKTAKDISVDDSEFTKPSDSKFKNDENSVSISVPSDSTVGGIIITSGTYKETVGITTYTHTTLIVSGAFDVEKDEISDTDRATLTFVGKRITADSALALAHTALVNGTGTNNTAGGFYVSGTVAIDNTCEVTNTNGTITVPGLIASNVNITGGTINAAKYEIPADSVAGTKKVYAYTNVPDAIDGAVEAGVKKVNVYGKVDVSKNITVPAGMDFVVNTGAELTIKKDIVAEVIFSDLGTAYLKNSGDIIVKGKLIIDNFTKSYKGVETGITSEVVVKSGLTYTYTTLEWAMQDIGTAEATLTLCGETKITKDTTIPENITVDTDGNDFSVSTGAVLTIDGMLYLNGGNYTVADEKGVVVNGLIKKDSVMTYDGKGYPAGLYLSDEDFAYYYIGSIEDAVALAILADNNALVYYGDLTAIAIDFDVKGTLVFEGDVKAASMETGSGAAVTFKKGVEIAAVSMDADSTITFATANSKVEGTYVSSVGGISFDKTKTNKADSKIAVAANDGATTMTLSGGFENASDVEDVYQVAMTGDVALKANLEELSVGIGTVTVGAKVAVDYFDVYGTLVIDNTYSMTSEEGWVYGSLIANAATDSKAKATATVGDLYVGVTEYEASGAIVSGDVTVSDYAIVSAGATVPGTIESMTYSTDVYVEGKEFLTVYGKDAADISDLYLFIDLGISDSNADFVKWVDEAGQKVDPVIGTPAAIYAVIDYDVYTVKIVTDAGVKSVAIGGIELSTAGGNTFVTVSPVSAGTYKVTYTMKSGYSGDAVLYTSSGTILKDNSFVISPSADYGEEKTLTFQLAGTAPTPEPEPVEPEKESEWTITTILLVILVILIAIMAVIVALRLNRS